MATTPDQATGDGEEGLDSLPLSALNALIYCPRRFYYEYVLGEMEVNAHVMQGRYAHQRVDSGERTRDDDQMTLRRIYVWSDRLRVHGYTDVLEETATGQLRPVEYKKGRVGDWLGDQIQLCAQALCLEERLGDTISSGEIYYIGSRQRHPVTFTVELRTATEEAIARAFALSRSSKLPLPLRDARRCEACSLRPFCLPEEVWMLGVKQGEPGVEVL